MHTTCRSAEEEGEPTEVEDEPPSKRKKKLAKILKKTRTMAGTSPISLIEKEMESYLSAPYLEVEGSPLSWWTAESVSYPIPSKLVKSAVLGSMRH